MTLGLKQGSHSHDFRIQLSPAAQHERRRQVIRAHKRVRARTQIAEEVGLSYTAVSKTIARYEKMGLAALAPRIRGRRSAHDRALSVAQEQAIQRTICDVGASAKVPGIGRSENAVGLVVGAR